MWNQAQAITFIQNLQPDIRKLGFNLALTGSVLLNGWSDKDLDLVLVPANWSEDRDPGAEVFFYDVKNFLRFRYGHEEPNSHQWSGNMWKFTYRVNDKLIDFFVPLPASKPYAIAFR